MNGAQCITEHVENVLFDTTRVSDMGIAYAVECSSVDAAKMEIGDRCVFISRSCVPPLYVPEEDLVRMRAKESGPFFVDAATINKFLVNIVQDGVNSEICEADEKSDRSACMAYACMTLITNKLVRPRNEAIFTDLRGLLDPFVAGLSLEEQGRIHQIVMIGCRGGMYTYIGSMIKMLGCRANNTVRARGECGRILYENCRSDKRPGKTVAVERMSKLSWVADKKSASVLGVNSETGQSYAVTGRAPISKEAKRHGVGSWDAVYGVLSGTTSVSKLDLGNIEVDASELIVYSEDTVRESVCSRRCGEAISGAYEPPTESYRLFRTRRQISCTSSSGILFYSFVCMAFTHEISEGKIYPDFYDDIEGFSYYKPIFSSIWAK
jgi:hypothetical protein